MVESNDLVLNNPMRPAIWCGRAFSTPEHLQQWWAQGLSNARMRNGPVPGKFYTRMTAPTALIEGHGCFLEVIEGEGGVDNVLGIIGRATDPSGCGSFPFTAIMTFETADGKTRYRAVAMHRSRPIATHEQMGHDGWGTAPKVGRGRGGSARPRERA